jgi:hypothetical protein
MRLLRRSALTEAIEQDEHCRGELRSAEHALADAKRRVRTLPHRELPELPGDPGARYLVRRLERDHAPQRGRQIQSRGLGIDR